MSASSAVRVPAVGEEAPDFTLPSTSGQNVTLSSFRGKQNVLLAFFPFAFSSVCTAELCAMRDDYDRFTASDVVVIPLSVDSKYALKEFKSKYGMQVDLLSDFKREAATAYGVLIPDKLIANRAYFLIDKTGVIRWEHVEENPSTRREDAEILDAISRLT
jgi:peroxiredoxin